MHWYFAYHQNIDKRFFHFVTGHASGRMSVFNTAPARQRAIRMAKQLIVGLPIWRTRLYSYILCFSLAVPHTHSTLCLKKTAPLWQRITACCSLRSAFGGDVALFTAYKWRHSDVIIIKLTAFIQNEIPYKTYISDFFCIWKITEFMPTCLRGAVFFLRHTFCNTFHINMTADSVCDMFDTVTYGCMVFVYYQTCHIRNFHIIMLSHYCKYRHKFNGHIDRR